MSDPYQAPESKLLERKNSVIDVPTISTWLVILFIIFSLHFYMYYWLISRSIYLNRIVTNSKIPQFILYFVPIFSIGTVFISIFNVYLFPSLNLQKWDVATTVASNVLLVVWYFWIRSALEEVLLIEKKFFSKVSIVLTFFLGILYLNYKINKIHKSVININEPA